MLDGRKLLARLKGTPLERILEEARASAERRAESLYVVGGCARDLVRRAVVEDLDLVVEGDPAGLGRDLARRVGGRVLATSLFETCRIQGPAGLRIDVAMSRRDVYRSPAALPIVFPAPIDEDLRRRDFTINSLAIALTGPFGGQILDPCGGLGDLRRGRLRLLHPASLADDPTRAFRGARYAARLGLRAATGWTRAISVAESSEAFAKLSPARLRREVELIGEEVDPGAVVALCGRWDLLPKIDLRLRAKAELLDALRRLRREHRGASPGSRAAVFVALLAWALPPERRRALCERLGFEGAAAREIAGAAAAASRARGLFAGGAPATAAARIRRAREVAGWDALAVQVATAAHGRALGGALRRERDRWDQARPRLKGDRILALGVARGPRVAALLAALRAARYIGAAKTAADEIELIKGWLGRPRES